MPTTAAHHPARWRHPLAAAALLVAGIGPGAAGQREHGDLLASAMPLATLAAEALRGDLEGATQYALSFGVTVGGTDVLKRVTKVQRPDGGDRRSFPSGHAARAFSSAAFVRARHGLTPALPVYAAALYVGHSRVQARRHRWVDVLGAAVLAEASAQWLVSPRDDSKLAWSLAYDGERVSAVLSARW